MLTQFLYANGSYQVKAPTEELLKKHSSTVKPPSKEILNGTTNEEPVKNGTNGLNGAPIVEATKPIPDNKQEKATSKACHIL